MVLRHAEAALVGFLFSKAFDYVHKFLLLGSVAGGAVLSLVMVDPAVNTLPPVCLK